MAARRKTKNVFEVDREAKEALQETQWKFGPKESDIFELYLELATPAITTAEKANAPVIGLPTLDGFLSYVAFRAALEDALSNFPNLSKRLIWQWNIALQNSDAWIDFELPIQMISLPNSATVFDCSIGLPVDNDENTLIPAGAYFARNQHDLITYPNIVDSIPLRRRVSKPFGRQIVLSRELKSNEGTTKALNNRLYFPLTDCYKFLFRGDREGVARMVRFAQDNMIGIGKKTTLGHGQIASFKINSVPSSIHTTWTHPILGNNQIALIKSLPFDFVYSRRESSNGNNHHLFGCERFAIVAAIETLGSYRPPYWLRERRTQIVRYGSIIQGR